MKMSNCIGWTLEDPEDGTKGIIVEQFGKDNHLALVRYWDDIWNKYDEMTMNIFNSMLLTPPDNRIMLQDPETLTAIVENCIDLALSTNDKIWFEELSEALRILKIF